MSAPKTSLVVFFPSKPLPGSTFHSHTENSIRDIVHEHLRSNHDIVDGYEITESDGSWYNDDRWYSDANWVIRIYVNVGFAKGLAENANGGPEAQYLARLAQMSCVDMGHAEFLAIINNNRAIKGNNRGLFIDSSDSIYTYTAILTPPK